MHIAFWFIMCLAVGAWGSSKGKSFWYGFLFSLILSPLIGAIIVRLTKKA